MLNLILYRYELTEKNIFGVLFIEKKYVADTLELPWRNNQRFISCIPVGRYPVSAFNSNSHGPCLALWEVPNREGIQIHAANREGELKGCIAVGRKTGHMILQSRITLRKILDLVGHSKGTLEIKEL